MIKFKLITKIYTQEGLQLTVSEQYGKESYLRCTSPCLVIYYDAQDPLYSDMERLALGSEFVLSLA